MIDATQLPAVRAAIGQHAPMTVDASQAATVAALQPNPLRTYVGLPRTREWVGRERVRKL